MISGNCVPIVPATGSYQVLTKMNNIAAIIQYTELPELPGFGFQFPVGMDNAEIAAFLVQGIYFIYIDITAGIFWNILIIATP